MQLKIGYLFQCPPMGMLIGEDKNVAGGETMCCNALRLGVLQYLTGLRNYALKAKLDDDF